MAAIIRLSWTDHADQSIDLPSYESAGAAGADIRANLHAVDREAGLTMMTGSRLLVPTGLRMEIPFGFEVQIRPRSGLAYKHGISIPNAPGTIDSDYRGELGVLLINLGDDTFHIAHGDRIAQMIVAPVVQADFAIFDSLDETVRGAGGFGSTGKS